MDPLVWIGIGLGVGLLAPLVASEGLGLFGDLLFGVLGAFLGGWTVAPLVAAGTFTGTAVMAVLGAVVFVAALRLSHRRSAIAA